MQGNGPNPNQKNFLFSNLMEQLNPKAPLLPLAKNLPWNYFERSFASLYSTIGLCDRGYRGKKIVGNTQIRIPVSGSQTGTAYQRRKQCKRFRARAGIEWVIGHLKSDHRFSRNFLKECLRNEINAVMAAAAFNFRKWLRDYYFCLYYIRHILGKYLNAKINAMCSFDNAGYREIRV